MRISTRNARRIRKGLLLARRVEYASYALMTLSEWVLIDQQTEALKDDLVASSLATISRSARQARETGKLAHRAFERAVARHG